MTNVFGTNLTTVDGANIKTGQNENDGSWEQLTTETGPLTHGIYLQTAASSFYITCDGTEPTTSNGVLVKANNPLFIPIKDPSTIKMIASGSGKTMTYIMY